MSIASEIARIKAARNKVRAQAIALGLKKWELQASKVFTSGTNCSLPTNIILNPSKTYKVRVSVTEEYLQFCEYDNLYDATEDGLSIGAMNDNDVGYSETLYGEDLVSPNVWEKIISGENGDKITISCWLYNECTDEYPLTMELFTLESITETDNLDGVADAFDAMPIKTAETITANALLENAFYKGCNVNVPTGEGACDHVQTEATVDFATGNVIFKDMNGNVLETSVYDANDIEKDKYVVNEVHVENVPDTTALENRVSELETELTNVETELKDL